MNTQGMRRFVKSFFRCGVAGWCLEVIFTSIHGGITGDRSLTGNTSLWMFPIYGMGALLMPMGHFLDEWLSGLPGFEMASKENLSPIARMIRHGLFYMVLIFLAEYLSGVWLGRLGIRPWDYSQWPDQVDGVIRLYFAPLWFGTGLLFEYLSNGTGTAAAR